MKQLIFYLGLISIVLLASATMTEASAIYLTRSDGKSAKAFGARTIKNICGDMICKGVIFSIRMNIDEIPQSDDTPIKDRKAMELQKANDFMKQFYRTVIPR